MGTQQLGTLPRDRTRASAATVGSTMPPVHTTAPNSQTGGPVLPSALPVRITSAVRGPGQGARAGGAYYAA